jgi:uncharacterized cupredoxin-like copper-binding protein
MQTRRVLITLAAAAALTGCGSDDETTTVSPGGSGSDSGAQSTGAFVVKLSDFKIDPKQLKASDPGAVTLTVKNDGDATHALEIEGQGTEKRTGDIAPGETATLTVTLKEGGYEWYCPIGGHRQLGMDGTVTVGGGTATTEDSGGGETATTDDSDEGETTTTDDSGGSDDSGGGGGSGSGSDDDGY